MAETYKIPISPEKFAADSIHVGFQMVNKGYRPDATIGIWRGGTVASAHITSVLNYYRIPHQSFSAKGKSYNEGINKQSTEIKIYNMEEIVTHLKDIRARRVNLNDDVFDTGRTYHAFHHILTNGLRKSDAVGRIGCGDGRHFKYIFDMKSEKSRYKLITLLENDITPVDAEVRITTPYWKPYANLTEYIPDFYLETAGVDEQGRLPWYVFDWEALEDLDKKELELYFPIFFKIARLHSSN
jgi:hypoxanthine phosphoribosyltransferase